MTRAVKAVSTYRGRDPRDFVLCGFGGNGPVVAAAIARSLQMRRVLVLAPGVFSGRPAPLRDRAGSCDADVRGRDASAGAARRLRRAREEAEAPWSPKAFPQGGGHLRFADIRYAGQAYELTLPVASVLPTPPGSRPTSTSSTTGLTARAADATIDIVNVKLTARAAANGDAVRPARRSGPNADETRRRAYWGRAGWYDVPVISRAALLDRHHGRGRDRRGVRRDLRRPAGLPRDARLAREHRHRPRPMTAVSIPSRSRWSRTGSHRWPTRWRSW